MKGNVMKNKSPGLFAFAWSLIIDHLFAVLITILITYYIVNKKEKKLKSQSK